MSPDAPHDSVASKDLAGGVRAILFISGGKSKVQAYRFPTSKFTASEAHAWIKGHNVDCMSFEAATGEEKGYEEGPERQLRIRLPQGQFIELGPNEGGGILIKNVPLLVEGTWRDSRVGTPLHYSSKTLKKCAENWTSNTLWVKHSGGAPRSIIDKIGEVKNQHFEKDGVYGDLWFHMKTQASRDSAELVRAGLVNFVSVEHGGKESYNSKEKRHEAEDITFSGVALVDRGACAVCTIRQSEAAAESGEMVMTEDVEKLKELEAAKADLEKKLAEATAKWDAAEKRSTELERRIETIEKTAKAQTQIVSTAPIIIPSHGVKIDRKNRTVTKEW